MTEKRRPGTHRDYSRTPGGGVPAFVDEELTPPPSELPRPRTPTPDDLRDKVNELARAVATVWPARHDGDRLDRLEGKIDAYTQSVARTEATAAGAWDAVKQLMPKLDVLVQQSARSEQMAVCVLAMDAKLDEFTTRFATIDTAQAVAAERFEAHDARDREIEKAVGRIDQRVAVLEQRAVVGDATAKVKRQAAARSWWFSAKGVSTVVAAVAAAVAAILYGGGCT